MRSWTLSALAVSLVFAACDSSSSTPPRVCATDIEVGEVQAFAMPTPSRSEGITFDNGGTLYISSLEAEADDQLLRVTTEGGFDVAAESPSILGLANHSRGIIAGAIATGELLLIDPVTGNVDVIADGLGAPNFVVVTPWDTMLVSDDSFGESTIREVTFEGEVSVWVEGVPTPNGMVFSLDGSTLYVAATFTDVGVWQVPVSPNGEAGTPQKWVAYEPGSTPDGLAIDSEGNVYVALNLDDQIAKITPDGTSTFIAENVGRPASLAFGRGSYDPCSIYVTNLFETQLWRIGTGVLGVE